MRGPHRALMILLIGLAAAHLAFAAAQPAPRPFGDETHYLKVVERDLRDGRCIRIEEALDETRAVAEVDEDGAAVVTFAFDPAAQGHFGSDVGFAELAAGVSA